MCLTAKSTFSEVGQIVAPFEHPLFIFDEFGDINHNQACAQLRNGPTLYKEPIVLNHDHIEDG